VGQLDGDRTGEHQALPQVVLPPEGRRINTLRQFLEKHGR
jgi:hypothetical protein